jgi:hypothetical protein
MKQPVQMLDGIDMSTLRSYCYGHTNVELAEKLAIAIETEEVISDLKEYIDEKYKQGYSYLDIAMSFKDNGNHTVITDEVFLVYISAQGIMIAFGHATYQIFKS